MKVLWFSNCILSREQSHGSGSWLFAMRDLICNDVELINITEGSAEDIECSRGNGIIEYLLPNWRLVKGVPSLKRIRRIEEIIQKEAPDIIHIWGVEHYWALLFSRGYIEHKKVLLEIQGVITACTDVFYGGLTPRECCNLNSVWNLIYPKYRLARLNRLYKKKATYEEELVRSFKSIAVQSIWTKEQLLSICEEKTSFYSSLRPIRQEFYNASKWRIPDNEDPVLFCAMSYYIPFKGLHFLFRALQILIGWFPRIKLKVAGYNINDRPFYHRSDYENYLLNLIKKYQLESNIHFCGALNASQMVDEIHKANVVINPSLVESYSAAAAEALYLGAPTVLAYSGAMVNFSEEEDVALYYNPLDYRGLAAKVRLLLENETLRLRLINNAIDILAEKCSPINVRKRQLLIYSQLESLV